MMVAVLTIGLFAFLLVGVPVALALGMAAAASLLVSGLPFTPTILSMRTQFGLQNFILLRKKFIGCFVSNKFCERRQGERQCFLSFKGLDPVHISRK